MDAEKIKKGVKLILEGMGEDPKRAGLKATPRRVAEMYAEIFSSLGRRPDGILKPIEGESHDEMILIKDIPFYSLCSHHLVPFYGHAHIGYVPGDTIVGLSKLARIVEFYAKRPQLQERLTEQVVGFLEEELKPQGAMVVIQARHLCVEMRGVKKPGAVTVTSAIRGLFHEKAIREEFLDLLRT